MLERIQNLPDRITGLRAREKVSKDDYDDVVAPMIHEARREGRQIRLLYHFAPEFDGFTPGGAWEDVQLGFRHLRLFERCAIVSDRDAIRRASRFIGAMLPCPVKVFSDAEWDEAVRWLDSPTEPRHVDHRLIPERSVLLVEPHGRLTVEDFDSIALTVDPWIESGRELNGLVVHVREFPGWETVGSFIRHMRFVRDHHRKVTRVALSADGKLAKLAPALVETFVAAEVQHFGYDEVDRAIEWASAPKAQGAAAS